MTSHRTRIIEAFSATDRAAHNTPKVRANFIASTRRIVVAAGACAELRFARRDIRTGEQCRKANFGGLDDGITAAMAIFHARHGIAHVFSVFRLTRIGVKPVAHLNDDEPKEQGRQNGARDLVEGKPTHPLNSSAVRLDSDGAETMRAAPTGASLQAPESKPRS